MSEFSHITLFNMSAIMEIKLQISAWRSEAKLLFPILHMVGHGTQVGSIRALHLQITVTNLPWSSFMTDSLCTAVPSTWDIPTTLPPPPHLHLADFHSSPMSQLIWPPPPDLPEWSGGDSIASVGPTSFPIWLFWYLGSTIWNCQYSVISDL